MRDFSKIQKPEKAEFVWRGQGSDPLIRYKGKTFNYWDVNDSLWEDFKDYGWEKYDFKRVPTNGEGVIDFDSGTTPEIEKAYKDFYKNNLEAFLDDIIGTK